MSTLQRISLFKTVGAIKWHGSSSGDVGVDSPTLIAARQAAPFRPPTFGEGNTLWYEHSLHGRWKSISDTSGYGGKSTVT